MFCWGTVAEAQITPVVSGAACDNSSYDPNPVAEIIQLCNDPLADGLFTEDGVTGYQYIYDVFMEGGCCPSFMIGGTSGPLGSAGTFSSQEVAWYRSTTGSYEGLWQYWGTPQVTDDGVTSHRAGIGVTGVSSVPGNVRTFNDGAALGDTRTDVWDTTVEHAWTGIEDASGTPIPIHTPIAWARDNTWHNPSEYGYGTDVFMPGFAWSTASQDPATGLGWTKHGGGIFVGGPFYLQHTFRVVSPYLPGDINWDVAGVTTGTVRGPNGVHHDFSCNGAIGDANCDGYVDVSNDVFPAFLNFTGPGSFGLTRADGDIHGTATGATTNQLIHDGDVDVTDLITMFANFTGPAPLDEAGGLVAAEVGDPAIPDLIYDSATGEVLIDLDGAVGLTGYVLNSANGFITGNHTPFMAGVTTTLPYELAEATFGTPAGPYPKSIGTVFPVGMDLSTLSAFLTGNQVSRGNNQPIVPFDLFVLGTETGGEAPEPATVVLAAIGLLGLGFLSRRRNRRTM